MATPVWFVEENGRLLVSTDRNSFKVKRIARDPSVAIASCTASGRLRGQPIDARAEFLPEEGEAHAVELMARKYRVDRVLIVPIYRLVQRLRGRLPPNPDPVFLAITPVANGARPATQAGSGS